MKSVLAVLAGFLVVALLSIGTDTILERAGIFPAAEGGLFDTGLLVLALAYRCLYALLGGYVTAALAPANATRLVTVLGIIGTLGGCIGIIVGWDLSPHWYPIALAITAFPCVWYGGRIKTA